MSMIIVKQEPCSVAGALGTGFEIEKEGVFNAVKESKETADLLARHFVMP